MTHDILQSDIELAKRLRDSQHPDEEIIRALVHRGIEAGIAAQFVDDLRSGKKVTAQSPTPAEFAPRRHSRSGRTAPRMREDRAARPPAAEAPSQPEAPPARQDRKNPKRLWQLLAVLAGLALLVIGITLFLRGKVGISSPEGPGPAGTAEPAPPQAPTNAAAATGNSSLPSLALELKPDGLHIGGRLVTRDELLPVVTRLLGAPTRTNQVTVTGTMVYAFDQQGVLVYSQPGGGTNSIVLDCEATGGTHGTTAPFTGLLKMQDRAIGPDMDSTALTAIKELNLQSPSAGGSVWNGRYHGLELIFAYLKSPRRLSLIEIDLK